MGMLAAVGLIAAAVAGQGATAARIETDLLDDGTVAHWTAALRDGEPGWRPRAADRLAEFGEAARAAVPVLVAAARTGEQSLRQAAVRALVEIGAAEDVTTPIVMEDFRKRGCEHLTGMGTFFVDISPERSLRRIGGPAVAALVEILNEPDRSMAVCAADMLGKLGPAAAPAVPDLIRAVEAGRASSYHVEALGRIGPAAKDAVPVILRLYDQQDDSHLDRSKILEALGRLDAPPVARLVDDWLRHEDQTARRGLCRLGLKARAAAPALRAALGAEKPPSVRLGSAVALAHVDPTSEDALPILIDALDHWNPPEDDHAWAPLEFEIMRDVPQALAALGPRAKPALAKMAAIAMRGEADVDLVLALVQVDPEGSACVPALIAALNPKDPDDMDVVACAAKGLAAIGPKAAEAGPALARAIGGGSGLSSDWFQRDWCVAQAIHRIGPDPKAVVPILADILKARDDRTWRAGGHVAQAIGSFGSAAEQAVPALIEAVRGFPEDFHDGDPRPAMAKALADIGPAARVAVPALRTCLDERGRDVGDLELIEALIRLTPEDREALSRRRLVGLAAPWNVARLRVGLGLTPGVRAEAAARREMRAIEELLDLDGLDPVEHGWLNLQWRFDRLALLGTAARPITPHLEKLRDHPDAILRSWARDALGRIMAAG